MKPILTLSLISLSFMSSAQTEEEKTFLKNINKEATIVIQKAKVDVQNGKYKHIDGDAAIKLAKKYEAQAKEIGAISTDIAMEAIESELQEEITQVDNPFGEGRDKDRIIFISFSMSRGEIKQALQTASTVKARVILNGLMKDTNHIKETLVKLNALSGNKYPLIQLNPNEFDKWNIKKVPVIAIDNGKQVFRATGTLDFDWMEREIMHVPDDVKRKAFGNRGRTYPVEEENLILAMQRKMMDIDWESKKKKTWDTYWSRTYNSMLDLPSATKTEAWYIDPTVEITKDITNDQGKRLAKGGQVMNPLSKFGVPFKLFIFNPDKKEEIEWVKEQHAKTDMKGDVMYLATHIDQERGWEAYQSLKAELGVHIYVLQPQIVERFLVSHTPSIVEPYNGLVKVQQFDLTEE